MQKHVRRRLIIKNECAWRYPSWVAAQRLDINVKSSVLEFRRQKAIYRDSFFVDLREFFRNKGHKVTPPSSWHRPIGRSIAWFQRQVDINPLRDQIGPNATHTLAEQPKKPRF